MLVLFLLLLLLAWLALVPGILPSIIVIVINPASQASRSVGDSFVARPLQNRCRCSSVSLSLSMLLPPDPCSRLMVIPRDPIVLRD